MGESSRDSAPVAFYRKRIGDPTNEDEVWGYWVFVVGILLGVAGIAMFATSEPASELRRWGIGLGGAGLLLLVSGPLYRLPLRPMANRLVQLGGLLALAGLAWFFVSFPGQWDPNELTATSTNVVLLYTGGLAVVALGGVLVPLATGTGEAEAEAAATERELAETKERLQDKDDRIGELQGRIEELEAGAAEGQAAADRATDLQGELDALRASAARFELFEDRAEEWRWRLRHRNGNVIADSGEGYTRKHNAQKGLQSVKRNALGAAVVREEIDAADEGAGEPIEAAPMQAPPEGEPPDEVEPDSQGTFEVYEDQGGEYRWRLVHDNGNVLADSGEGYTRRGDAREAVERVRGYAGPASYLRVDPVAFEVFRDRADEWRWRLIHENGNVLADSGEGYASRWNARRAVEGVRNAVAGETDADFETYEDNRGEYRWRLVHANGNIIADGGEGYAEQRGVEDAVERLREYAGEADLLDIGAAAFEVYEDAAEQWRWRLRHRNGNVMADSGQGYGGRSRAEDGIDSVKRHAPGADVTE
jgi:uncharacterized protein YegP (UPF0339 family)